MVSSSEQAKSGVSLNPLCEASRTLTGQAQPPRRRWCMAKAAFVKLATSHSHAGLEGPATRVPRDWGWLQSWSEAPPWARGLMGGRDALHPAHTGL